MKMTWDKAAQTWILETETPISQSRFLKVWEYTLKDQKRQIENMKSGPEREVYQDAFKHLKSMNITHSIKPQGGAN
jgi:hypothetical protein